MIKSLYCAFIAETTNFVVNVTTNSSEFTTNNHKKLQTTTNVYGFLLLFVANVQVGRSNSRSEPMRCLKFGNFWIAVQLIHRLAMTKQKNKQFIN